MTNELVTIEQAQVRDVFTKVEVIKPILDRISALVKAEVYDVSTEEGRAHIALMADKIKQSKNYIEAHGKELADEIKAMPKLVDANRKLSRDYLDALREEIRAPLTAYEAEQAAIQLKLQIESDHEQALIDHDLWTKAQAEKAAKEAKERAEYEAKIRAEVEHRAKAEADERARREIIEAQARAIAEQEKTKRMEEENKRLLAEAEKRAQLEKEEAIAAERKKVEDARLEKEAEAKRIAESKATEEHKSKIIDDAFFSIIVMTGLNEEQAGCVLKAIIDGKIDHISINY